MTSKTLNGKTYYFNDNGRKLLSYSNATKPFDNRYLLVNVDVLNTTAAFGQDIMLFLAQLFNGGGKASIDYTPPLKTALKCLISKLDAENKKVIYIEKHIFNDTWHGFIDIECENCFIELKTRSNTKLELQTVIQCEIYKRICKKNYEIWYYNKKSNTVATLKPTPEQILKANAIINSLELVNNLLN